MSYDLERAVERAADRLRGIAQAKRRDGDEWLATALNEVAQSLQGPLDDVQLARVREEERALAARLRRGR